MLRYGMVGEIDDFARVVAWDFNLDGVNLHVLEKEVQVFVPGFELGGTDSLGEGHSFRVRFRFKSSEDMDFEELKAFHVLEPEKDWLVYFFESKQLRKYPVMDIYRLFKRAF
jgi:hypothetical protein